MIPSHTNSPLLGALLSCRLSLFLYFFRFICLLLSVSAFSISFLSRSLFGLTLILRDFFILMPWPERVTRLFAAYLHGLALRPSVLKYLKGVFYQLRGHGKASDTALQICETFRDVAMENANQLRTLINLIPRLQAPLTRK